MDNPMPGLWNQSTKNKSNENTDIRVSLAVAALVLGVVSVAMSIAVTGFIFGLAGTIIGIVCLAGRYNGKSMAGWGLGLSVAGMLASCLFGLIYYAGYLEGTEDFDLEQDDYDTKTIQEWIGESAPDFTVTDVEGNEFTLSEMTGRRVALNFWLPSSLLCRDAVDHFVELRKSVPEEKLAILGLSYANADEVQGVGRRLGINYPLVSTYDLPSPYDEIYGEPTTIFIDRDGIVQSILEDYHDFEKLKILSSPDDYEKGKVNDPNT